MSDTDYKDKYNHLLADYNRLVNILNTGIEMLEALDHYRKTKDKRDLFKTHNIETTFKKQAAAEIKFQEQKTQKLQAA